MIEDLLRFKTDIQPGPGKLLIAEPLLQEETFHRSVIYLCHHDEKESVGYVLNRHAQKDLSFLVEGLRGIEFPLYVGGPVDLNSLHLIHTMPDLLGGEKVTDKIWWSGDIDAAIEAIKLGKLTPSSCKFFVGYSGWGEGQLDAELDMNSWLVSEASLTQIFDVSAELLWSESIKQLGEKYRSLLYVPKDPQMN
ncbi:MAG: YqgE/AlgH family protein [Chitinophagaceae bacterium]|nr:YqgE/AlgH family protein [Chitinophagaceae bacterium]